MTTFTIRRQDWREALDAVLPHTGDPSFPALDAVHIECDGKGLTFVATDRYTLGVWRHDLQLDDDETAPEPFTLLLRRSAALDSLRLFRPRRSAPIRLKVTVEDGRLSLHDDLSEPDLTLASRGVDSEFPKWRSIITSVRREDKGLPEGVALNGHYVARWAAAVRHSEPVRILAHGANKALLVSVGDSFMGVQMPVRTEEALFDADRWQPILDGPPKVATQKKVSAA